jgi:ribonuclease D
MKKTIYHKYDKQRIADLPRVLFEGRIVVILTESEAQKAVDYLLSQPILGVDTETRPSFKKGRANKVALLQVASHEVCFLFRLNQLGISPAVKRLLEDKKVPKIGLSWHDDLNMLHKSGDFETGCFVDLQDHVREIGVEDLSLQKLYANFFGQKISKRERLTNWEADVLNDKQKQYAATDAWACIMLYEELMRLEETGDYELIKTVEDVQADSVA